jgi:hypothetical protein
MVRKLAPCAAKAKEQASTVNEIRGRNSALKLEQSFTKTRSSACRHRWYIGSWPMNKALAIAAVAVEETIRGGMATQEMPSLEQLSFGND